MSALVSGFGRHKAYQLQESGKTVANPSNARQVVKLIQNEAHRSRSQSEVPDTGGNGGW